MISIKLCLIESLIIALLQLLLHAIDMFSASVVLVLGQVLSDSRLGENLWNVYFVALTCNIRLFRIVDRLEFAVDIYKVCVM